MIVLVWTTCWSVGWFMAHLERSCGNILLVKVTLKEEWKWCIKWSSNGRKPHTWSFLIGCGHVCHSSIHQPLHPSIHPSKQTATYSSMALFHMMTYPDKMKDSMLTMCVFPRSVPTYSHLLWKGRWQKVILQNKRKRKSQLEPSNYKGTFDHVFSKQLHQPPVHRHSNVYSNVYCFWL